MQPLNVVVKVVAFVARDGKHWTAQCPALNIFTEGRTRHEAQEKFADAMQLNIEAYQERGMLGDVIQKVMLDPNVWLEPRANFEAQQFEMPVQPGILNRRAQKTVRAAA